MLHIHTYIHTYIHMHHIIRKNIIALESAVARIHTNIHTYIHACIHQHANKAITTPRTVSVGNGSTVSVGNGSNGSKTGAILSLSSLLVDDEQ